ncbi:flagellar biosynthetic protein FliO [Cytobacillus gottheilii]|uniref:flagellar biosynthetic protein FliO n=1 Tax=Cytobacillus gottheilii TaxID=859144 RepID=UPI00214721EC|nr:flagellar biosynthetic protein FliO [Cytobacillus gottheilii]
MFNKGQQIVMLVLFIFAALGLPLTASAEQIESVKDYLEQKGDKGTTETTEEQEEANTGTEAEGPDEVLESDNIGINFWDVFKMIAATIFVIGLLYALLKVINKRNRTFQSTQLVENLGGASLGNNRSIQVIKTGESLLIVGVGENIQVLKEINDPEEYSKMLAVYNDKIDQLVQPSDIVTKVMNRMRNTQPEKGKGNSFQSILKKQMDDMAQSRKKILDEMKKKGSDEQ